MKRHYIKEKTPLKYHKFSRWVGLPLGILLNLFVALNMLLAEEQLNWGHAIDLTYSALAVILGLTAFIGFFRWTPASWYAAMGIQVCSIVYYFAVLLITARFAPDGIASALGTLLGGGAVSVLIMVYYAKRRPLFFPQEVPVQMECGSDTASVLFCRKCGERLAEGSRFCCRCGADSREGSTPEMAAPEEKKSSRKWLVAGIFAVLIVAAVLCAVLIGSEDTAEEIPTDITGPAATDAVPELPPETSEVSQEPVTDLPGGETDNPGGTADAETGRQAAAWQMLYTWVEENYTDTWNDGTVSYVEESTDEELGTVYDMDIWLYSADEIVLQCTVWGEDYIDIIYVSIYADGQICPVEYVYYDSFDAEEPAFYGWAELYAPDLGREGAIVFEGYESVVGSDMTDANFAEYVDSCAGVAEALSEMMVWFADYVLYDLVSGGLYSMADFGFAS